MRDTQKMLARLDQALNPKLGPRPVKKLKDIPYINLSSSDEEPNKRAHPKGWIGREIQQTEFDEAMKLVNPINYIRLPGSFGNLPGDKNDKTSSNFLLAHMCWFIIIIISWPPML